MGRGFFSVWSLLIFFLVLIVLTLSTLPSPNVLVSSSLTTEAVRLTVQDPEENMLRLPHALADSDNIASACLTDVVIRPDAGTEVYYTRTPDGAFIVSFNGPTNWRASGRGNNSGDYILFTVSPASLTCKENQPPVTNFRVPIAGTMIAGFVAEGTSNVDEPSSYLLSGKLQIYGRAVHRVLFLPMKLLSFFLPVEPNKLYHAGEFDIPAGSAFGSDDARWWGFADVDLTRPRDAIQVKASTNARNLKLQAPASYLSEGKATNTLKSDTISLTFGARLSNDPNLRWLFAAVSFLFALISLSLQMSRKPT